MGSNKSKLLSVDEKHNNSKQGKAPGFTKNLFAKKSDFELLKEFCNKYSINQRDLVIIFSCYLSNEKAFLRDFRIGLLEFKAKFLKHSKLIQEIADIFLPTIFVLKEYEGLEAAHSAEEVSFTRFIIISYLFCGQQIPDLVYDLFAILKKNMTTKLESSIVFVYLSQLLTLLMSDLEDSAAKRILLSYLKNTDQDQEITLRSIIILSSKYPLLFYYIERFRKHLKRMIFGDKFWDGRKYLKIKHKSLILPDSRKRFLNESTAIVHTSRSFICDVLLTKVSYDYKRKCFPLTDIIHSQYDEDNIVINNAAANKLKDIFGYKLSKLLILDSLFPIESDLLFLDGFQKERATILTRVGDLLNIIHPSLPDDEVDEDSVHDGRMVIYDADNDRNFCYDCNSGDKSWALLLFHEDGECFDEIYF